MSGMMDWIEVCIHTKNEAIEPVSNILHEEGAAGVAIEDPAELEKERPDVFGEMYSLSADDYPKDGVYVKAYLADTDELPGNLERIEKRVLELRDFGIDIGKGTLTKRDIVEESWANAWKQYYKPVEVSERITIVPEWEAYTPKREDEKIIKMDPGMAFGTGTHATTSLVIQALDRFVKKNDFILDVGCGSGILGIAALLLGASEVHAYDIDEVAVESTISNAKLNGFESQLIAEKNSLLEGIETEADLIVSNILAEVIVQFTDDAWKCLKPGGRFLVSGIISEKRQMVEDRLLQSGFEMESVSEQEDWISIVAKKQQ